VVANSHHGVATIDGDNIMAMFEAARELRGSVQAPWPWWS